MPRIIDYTEGVRSKLLAVHTTEDLPELHAARIAGKRLRYVLEPLAPYHPDVAPVVGRLKLLQDAAGELHDAYLFTNDVIAASQPAAATYAKRLTIAVARGDLINAARVQRQNPAPGILALAARLRERRRCAFETLRREWLDGAADAVLRRVRAIADEVWSEYCSGR